MQLGVVGVTVGLVLFGVWLSVTGMYLVGVESVTGVLLGVTGVWLGVNGVWLDQWV